MMTGDYFDFFTELKETIVKNGLDSNANIHSASIAEIEDALQLQYNQIPKAYLAFLLVFSNGYAKSAFNDMDFYLDTRQLDKETALELYPSIITGTDEIVISERLEECFYIPFNEGDNPAVYRVWDSKETLQIAQTFTAFVNNLVKARLAIK